MPQLDPVSDSPSLQKATTAYTSAPAPDFEAYARSLGAPVDEVKQQVAKESKPTDEMGLMGRALSQYGAQLTTDQQQKGDVGKGVGLGLADVTQNVINSAHAVVKGLTDFGADHGILPQNLVTDASKIDWSAHLGQPDDSVGVRTAREITKYAAPVLATVLSGGGTAASLGVGAAADFLTLDPHQQRLSNTIRDNIPELQNYPVAYKTADWLAAKPGEGDFEGRAKNALEGLGLGAAMAGTVHGILWAGSKMSSLRGAVIAANPVAQAADGAAAPLASEAQLAASDQAISSAATTPAPAVVEASPPPEHNLFKFDPVKEGPAGPVFNLNNEKVVDFAARFAQENPKEYSQLFRETQTFTQMTDEAQAILRSPQKTEELLARTNADRPFSAAETAASHYLLGNVQTELETAAAFAVQSGKPEDLQHFQNMLSTFNYVNETANSAATAQARALNANKIKNLNPFNISSDFHGMTMSEFTQAIGDQGRQKLISEALAAGGGQEAIADTAKKIDLISKLSPGEIGAKLSNPEGVYASATGWQSKQEALTSIAINGMLSSPYTAAKVAIAYPATGMMEAATNYIAAGIGTIKKSTGLAPVGSDAISFAQANKYLQGYFSSFGESAASAGRAFMDGHGGPGNMMSGDFLQGLGKIGAQDEPAGQGASSIMDHMVDEHGLSAGGIKSLVEIPSRIHAAEGAFFGNMTYRASIYQQAMAKAENSGLLSRASIEDAFHKLIENPTVGMHTAAVDRAQMTTFWKALDPESISGSINQIINKVPFGRVILPFFKVGANSTIYAMENSPLGALFPEVKQAIAQGGAARDMAIARMTLGSSFVALGAGLAANGVYTGPDTENSKVRQALEESGTGWRSESLLLGGRYIKANGLGPINAWLKLGSVISQLSSHLPDEQYHDVATIAAAAFSQVMTPEMMTENTSKLFEAMAQASQYGKKDQLETVMADIAGRFTPFSAFQRDLKEVGNPIKSSSFEARAGFLENVTNRIIDHYGANSPWFNKDLPPVRNMWGEPLLMPHGALPEMLAPYASTKGGGSELTDKLQKLAGFYQNINQLRPEYKPLSIEMPSRNFSFPGTGISIPLDSKQYDKLVMYRAGLTPEGAALPGVQTLKAQMESAMSTVKGIGPQMTPNEYNTVVGALSKIMYSAKVRGNSLFLADSPEVQDKFQKAMEARNVQHTIGTFQ